MKEKIAFMIDGWFMRKRIYKTRAFYYSAYNIRKYCQSLLRDNQQLFRIYYYDTAPLEAKGHNPISKKPINFGKTKVAKDQNKILTEIRTQPNFALRLGTTNWRGSWSLTKSSMGNLLREKVDVKNLCEKDVIPLIEQKGVDMKIGLDIASISYKKIVDKIIVVTGDQDIVPALKLARKEGIVVGVDSLENPVNPLLSEHVDFFKTNLREFSSSQKKETRNKPDNRSQKSGSTRSKKRS